MTDALTITDTGRPAVSRIALTALLDDDRWFDTLADQRDQRVALQLVPDPERDKIGFQWACAWAYLQRTGQVDGMGWAMFQKHIVQVMPTPGVDVVTPVDPTGPGPAG
jgi:hypothetical protein